MAAATLVVASCGTGNPPNRAVPNGRGDGGTHLVLVGERVPELTVLRFEIDSGTCGQGRPRLGTVDVQEGADAVTVTAIVVSASKPSSGFCAGVGIIIPVTVALKNALGARRILDGSCSPPAVVVTRNEARPPCSPTAQQQAEEGAVGMWHAFDAGPLATRGEPRAVWTGKEMIVLGGLAIERYAAFDDGAAYDPVTNKWRLIAKRPDPGRMMGVAWTGTEVFALGQKEGIDLKEMRSAHLYNPATNQWRPVSAPPRGFDTPDAWWTGHEVVVWQLGGGALYNPATDTWRDIPPIDIAGVTAPGRARWLDGAGVLAVQAASTPATGGPLRDALLLFDPQTNKWKKAADPPEEVQGFSFLYAAWLGTEEIFNSSNVTIAYDPQHDRWRKLETPTTNADQGTAYFTGTPISGGRGVVRVGDSHRPLLLIDANTGSWSHAAAPDGKLPAPDAVVLWTGRDVLVWGRPGDATASDPNAAWMWSPP